MQELRLEQVLDGYPLIYHLATQAGPLRPAPSDPSETSEPWEEVIRWGEEVVLCTLQWVGDDLCITRHDTGETVRLHNLYISSIRYGPPLDSDFTEDVVLVGNSRLWKE